MGLFLTQYDANALPYAYVGIASTVVLLSIVYLKLGQRFTLARLLLITLIFLLATSIAAWMGLRSTRAGWFLFGLPIWYEVLWTLTSLAFWNLAGRVINVRQGKRLFGVVSSGESVAVLLGGLLVPLLVSQIGTEGLFLAVAGVLLLTIGVLTVINRAFGAQLDLPLEQPAAEAPESAAQALKNRYVLLLAHLFGLSITTHFVIDALFYAQAEVRYADEAALAGFVGVFFGVAGFVGLLSRLVGTGWLIRRFSVRVGVLIQPIAVGIGLLLVGLALNLPAMLLLAFWFMAVTKLLSQVFITSTTPVTFNIFYQPLPPLRRTQTQTLVEGIIYPLAIGVAGGGLALLTGVLNFGPLQLLAVALGLIVLWVITGIYTTREYPAALRQALTKRKISGEGLHLDDDASRAVLVQSLQNPTPAVALHALAMLEDSDPALLAAHTPNLLHHPASEIRQTALRVIERNRLIAAIPAVVDCLQTEPEAAVRASALGTLASMGQTEAIEQIYPALNDPNQLVQPEAIVALLRYTGIEVAMMAEGKLLNLSLSEIPAERITAAKIVGQVTGRNLGDLLDRLLSDPDINVRRAALQAAGTGNNPLVWPQVITELDHPTRRNVAMAALIAGGEAALPNIIAAFEQSPHNGGLQQRLAKVCGRIGGPRATAFLVRQLDHPNAAVRTQVLAGLHRCGYQADEAGYAAIQQQFKAETGASVELLTRQVDFEQAPADHPAAGAFSLLQASLEEQLDQLRARVFWLLSFIYPRDKILQARDNLALTADKKAYALEILDLTLSVDVKTRLFPLIETLTPQQRLAQLVPSPPRQDIAGHLSALICAPANAIPSWDRACAIFAAYQLDAITPALAEQLRRLIQLHPAGPLREAAQTALNGDIPMYSTIEKVLILKTIKLFEETSGEILAEVAALLADVELLAGQTVFEKNDPGDCMYIIVSGRVKAHDGDTIFNTLTDGDVFGEMALLDPEPRVASITALEDTHLLRLDREPFFELMEDRIEVARGVIRVLSGHLRNRVRDVAELKAQVAQLQK